MKYIDKYYIWLSGQVDTSGTAGTSGTDSTSGIAGTMYGYGGTAGSYH